MESLPESKGIERTRASSSPTLRLKDPCFHLQQNHDASREKPYNYCHSLQLNLPPITSPVSDSPKASYSSQKVISTQGNLRSRSSNYSSPLPKMSRTHSMPNYDGTNYLQIPQSRQQLKPRNSVPRIRSPRKLVDEAFVGFPNRYNLSLPGISDLVITEDESATKAPGNSNAPKMTKNAFYSRTRRPISPRLVFQQTTPYNMSISSPQSITNQTSIYTSRFMDQNHNSNYCYSGSLSYPGSFSSYSTSSTPTSARSRSSSISSLETIPDSPDAEEAALEEDRIARLKDEAVVLDSHDELKTLSSKEYTTTRGRFLGLGRDKRQRWSVCGAERRGDLNLDTIWED